MINPEQLTKLISWLQDRIEMARDGKSIIMSFDIPSEADFIDAGFDQAMIDLTLNSSWWEEMITDIIETPDFVDPDSAPPLIIKYARDIVNEYVGKRIL